MSKVRRLTVKIMVTAPRVEGGLGYCCPYAFFRVNKQTGAIAARLGVDDRTVRYHKMAFKDGKMKCEVLKECLKGKLF